MNLAVRATDGFDLPVATWPSFKSSYLESSSYSELRFPCSDNNVRNIKVCLKFHADRKINASIARGLLSHDYEPHQRCTVQEMVDLLHVFAQERLLTEAKAVHGYILRHSFFGDNLLVLLNHVMHAYSKCSGFELARTVFSTMSHRNVFSWTVMIVGSSENGLLYDSFGYFIEMQKYGICPDAFAYSAILRSCVSLHLLELGEMLHAQIIIRGFVSNLFVCTSLLTMYAKLGEIGSSFKVFSNVTDRNEVSWNAMIAGFSENGLYSEAIDLFLVMIKEGYTLDVCSLVSVLKAVGMLGDALKGKLVHRFASEFHMQSNIHVGTALINMYAKCGALCDARSVFDSSFSGCELNMPWNAIIAAYSECGQIKDALELYIEMNGKNIEPDVYTFCSVLDAIADMKCLKLLREVHAMVLKTGYCSTVLSVENAVADAYSKCNSLEDVRKVFDRMEQRDLTSWTTVVGAYCNINALQEAVTIYSQMRIEGHRPNQFTISTILNSCAGNCQLELGQQLHGFICKCGLDTDDYINGSLIDMYAKCGSIKEARKAFDLVPVSDVVSWTAVIYGYALHGCVAHALELFWRMQKLNVRANAVTFLCLLSACSHAGMVEEGLKLLWSMKRQFGLEPEMEHYACVVDIFGRAGHLNEAFSFVNSMPIKPDEMVWETLLAACRIHGNVALGETAANKILSLRPEYSAAHVLLSNTYMEHGNIRDGLQLRMEMKQHGIKKEPGYSSISLKGAVHKFYAGDQDHPQKNEMYTMLAQLKKMIKAFGYAPDLKFALHGDD